MKKRVKKNKQININITISNRWLYTFVVLGILALFGIAMGTYAYGTSTPSTFGHSIGEIDFSEGINGWTFSNDYISDDGEQIIKTSDEWLRLNQNKAFSNGIYTPGKIRSDGGIYVEDDEYFYSDEEDVIKTDDNLEISTELRVSELVVTESQVVVSGFPCLESEYGEIRRCSNTKLCACTKKDGQLFWAWNSIIS